MKVGGFGTHCSASYNYSIRIQARLFATSGLLRRTEILRERRGSMTSSGVCEGQVGHALEAKIWREKIADALKQNIWQIS